MKKTRKQKNTEKRNLLITGTLLLGVGAYMVVKKEDKPLQTTGLNANNATILKSEKVVKKSIVANRTQGMKLKAQKAVGFVPVTAAQEGNWDFGIKIGISDNKCRLGDYDIIQRELQLNRNKSLYLTVENLNSGEIYSQTRVNLKGISDAGFEKSFSLKSDDDPTYLGVFLCTKSSPKQPCMKQFSKKVDDIDSMQREAIGKGKYSRKGKMFFFQYLTAIDGKLQIFKMNNLLNSHFNRMESVYKKLDPDQTYRKPMKMARVFSQRIGSLKPAVRFGKISVYLPRKSPSCPVAKFAP